MSGLRTLELLARAGFLVKGALYVVVGILAFQVAARMGGRVTGVDGAFATVLAQPYGRTLLLAAAIGLFGYAAWRLVQAILDTDRRGRDWKALAMRVSFAARGIVHAALGLQAYRLHQGLSAASDTSRRELVAEAFGWPFGGLLVVLAGLGVIGFAVHQVYVAVTCQLGRDLEIGRLRREAGEWAVALSRFGIAARAVVFALLGWGLADAGWSRDVSEVGTTATSLQTLAAQPGGLGRWLLGVTGAGFAAYGLYQFIHARYLQIRLPR